MAAGQARRDRIESICEAALAQPSDHRAAFVREACGADTSLQADVEALLAYASRDGALDQPLAAMAARVFDASASREAPALSAGTRFGVYEIVHLIDAGGMGQVYRARDTDLGRFVALKVLRPEVAADRDRSARLEHEARVLASLSHPNIAAIHGVVRGADRIALASARARPRAAPSRSPTSSSESSATEDASYGVGDIIDHADDPGDSDAKKVMIGALGGIAAALGKRGLGI